ncbi:MAG: four helix bundle protein [Patescibacteria group bacterium]
MFEFYKKFYRLRTKISKQDRHGIYSKLDALILDAIALAIKARFQTGIEKVPTLKDLRTNIEILKRMVRLMQELDIIGLSLYQAFEEELQEISKETNGWIGSFQKNNRLL